MIACRVIGAAALLVVMEMHPVRGQTNQLPALQPTSSGIGTESPALLSSPPDIKRWIYLKLNSFHLATNFVVAAVKTGEEVPSEIALTVIQASAPATNASENSKNTNRQDVWTDWRARREEMKTGSVQKKFDLQRLSWIPFTTNLPIDLGPGDGKRTLYIVARWGGATSRVATGETVVVDHAPPVVNITNPPERVTSQPLIDLRGYTDEPVHQIRYDLLNTSNHVAGGEGSVNDQSFDTVSFEFTRNYFTCYDIELAPGTNVIVLRCEDLAGNSSTNRLTYFFTFDYDKTPPAISLAFPANGGQVIGDSFTARGQLDDTTARMTAQVGAYGETNVVQGLVERNGYFWVENVPLNAGANHLTFTATDAAGNSSHTNLVVYRSDEILTMDPIPADQVSWLQVTVTGKVFPRNRAVWINGTQAQVAPDGAWVANNVPVQSPSGGTAVFEMSAIPSPVASVGAGATNQPPLVEKPQEVISVVAGLTTNSLILNPQQPSCGAFNLHLIGTAGRDFVLFSSTNLTNWTPILTNLNSQPTFDFTDSNVAGHKCRFFRVIPLP
jgi:hypothetical protein